MYAHVLCSSYEITNVYYEPGGGCVNHVVGVLVHRVNVDSACSQGNDVHCLFV